MERAFLAGFGFGGALLAAAPAAAGDGPVVVRLGGETLRIPAAVLRDGPPPFWERALHALGLSAPPVFARLPDAELPALAPGRRADGRGGFEWSMEAFGPGGERAWRRAEREFAARVWFGREGFGDAEVQPHASGLHRVQPRDWRAGDWLAVRTPPAPARPAPADLLAARCWTLGMPPATCAVEFLHRGLLVRFDVAERDLRLLDALRDAVRRRIDAWREAP